MTQYLIRLPDNEEPCKDVKKFGEEPANTKIDLGKDEDDSDMSGVEHNSEKGGSDSDDDNGYDSEIGDDSDDDNGYGKEIEDDEDENEDDSEDGE